MTPFDRYCNTVYELTGGFYAHIFWPIVIFILKWTVISALFWAFYVLMVKR